MKTKDTVNNWLKEISQTLNIDLELDPDGVCAIQFKEDMLCILEVPENSEEIFIYSSIMPIPQNKEQALILMNQALEMNLFMGQTQGATIAKDGEMNQLMLCYNLPIQHSNPNELASIIDKFFKIALQIREQLETHSTDETSQDLQNPGIRA